MFTEINCACLMVTHIAYVSVLATFAAFFLSLSQNLCPLFLHTVSSSLLKVFLTLIFVSSECSVTNGNILAACPN